MRADQPKEQRFPATRIMQLLLNLKASLSQAAGQSLSFDDWGHISARPANTLANWCAGGAAHQLEVLLASLERLTTEERHRLIDRACREYPTLRHPRLIHDPVACSQLATLLRQTSGLTLIRGPEHLRTFLLTALGHSAGTLELKSVIVAGVDAHQPDHFVPVSGVIYLGNLLRGAEIERQCNRLWPALRATKAQLVIFNDIWRWVPALQPEILALAQTAHVVVADALAPTPTHLASRVQAPAYVVAVSPAREKPEWVRVEIQVI